MERPITNSSIMPETPQSVLQGETQGLITAGKVLYGSKAPPPIQLVGAANPHSMVDRLGKPYRVRPESCRSTASSNLAPPSNGVP